MEPIGESESYLQFQTRLSRAAKVDRPVLIVGERGTGKELAASRLHYLSSRWEEPLVTVNCATLTETLLESELFGHEAGAFTGATQRRQGRFEVADGGTLFLDEIGQIPMAVQEKILRVVEYGKFERVGSSESIEVNVRILGATNADLLSMAEAGTFKPDLLDRLSFEVLYLPPLRYRKEDISLLARHFAEEMAMEIGLTSAPEFSEQSMEMLERHPWPGNIRELKNCIERAVYASEGRKIRTIRFDPFENPFPSSAASPRAVDSESADYVFRVGEKPLREAQREMERRALETALDRCQYHQGRAAELLGLNTNQFRGIHRKHGLGKKAPGES